MLRRSTARLRRPLPAVRFVAASLLLAAPALAAPTAGFIERWPSTTSGWGGSAAITYSNPLNGGFEDDGFLMLSTEFNGNFGTRSSGTEYIGNWFAAGITSVSVRLNDLAQDNVMDIKFSIGAQTNLWQHNIGLVPPVDAWAEYTIDLTDSASFTRIVGIGSFAGALQNTELIHLRHDLAPYAQIPNATTGDLGIDHLHLIGSTVDVPGGARPATRPVELAVPSPNPSRGPVALTLRVSDDSPVQVRVLDAQGRSIRSERLAPGAGVRVWVWDGRDDAGRVVAAGVYRAIATSRAGGTSRSLVRVN